jgi:uncharacterized protein YkwD
MMRALIPFLFLCSCLVAPAGRAQDADLVRQVVKEMSDARFRPRAWAKELREMRRHMDGKVWRLPGRTALQTEEGLAAIDDAIAFLEAQKPLGPLRFNAGLGEVAAELATDQAKSGGTGHKDRKGRSLFDRLQSRGSVNSTAGEAISYGPSEAHDIALMLIIDDGVADRGHRRNIFNPDFHQAGAALATHPEWGTVCVIDFADGFVPLKP